MKTLVASLTAFALLSGAALAQAPAAGSKNEPVAQKFMSLDVDKSGFLDGKELDGFKDTLKFLDMDKDGKVSPSEYNVGVMTGAIK